jgi:methionyl aminopeptidase
MVIIIKSLEEIELIRASSKALFEIHLSLSSLIRPGITTQDLEHRIAEMMSYLKVTSSFKGYMGFTAVAYFDINNSVCHTPPSNMMLKDGDIVKIGAGIIKNGFHADKTVTYPVGEIDDQAAAYETPSIRLVQSDKRRFNLFGT